MTTFADHAEFYLKLGWPVFPLQPIVGFGTQHARCGCGHADCRQPGKHPLIPKSRGGQGFKDATLDPDQIAMWDYECPQANIATATGEPSKIIVVDIDGEEGEASVRKLADVGRVFKPTATVLTGRGRHLYYHFAPGLRCSAGKLAPGIDLRAEGGQAVLPPSKHVSGRTYRWDPSPVDLPPARTPFWIPHCIESYRKAQSKKDYERYTGDARMKRDGRRRPPMEVIDGYCLIVAQAQKGTRNATLNEQAFNAWRDCKRYELREVEVYEKLMAAAKASGLIAREAVGTIKSAQRGAYTRT